VIDELNNYMNEKNNSIGPRKNIAENIIGRNNLKNDKPAIEKRMKKPSMINYVP
jgi:hypothetical protein